MSFPLPCLAASRHPRATRAPIARLAVTLMLTLTAAAPLQAGDAGLSVAGPGFPAAFVLTQFAAQADALANQAAADGALEASRAAREAQLLLANVRAELQAVATERWDRLAAPQQALLRELDSTLADARRAAGAPGRVEDQRVALDLGPRSARLDFAATTPVLWRVEGANAPAQPPQGGHVLRLDTNLQALGASGYAVALAGQPVPADWLRPGPAGQLLLTLPAEALARLAGERGLQHVPVALTAVLPSPTWKFWQAATYEATLAFNLALYPRKAFTYTLQETVASTAVDSSRELVAKGRPHTIAGCGAPGCERFQNVCNDAPAGARPIEPAFFTDSAAGDSDGAWVNAITPSPSGFCVLYRQRSPDVAREVNFDIRYNPARAERKAVERRLRAVAASQPATDADALEPGRDYGAELAPQGVAWTLTLKAFNGQTYAAGSDSAATSPLLRVQTAAATPAAGPALAVRVQLP